MQYSLRISSSFGAIDCPRYIILFRLRRRIIWLHISELRRSRLFKCSVLYVLMIHNSCLLLIVLLAFTSRCNLDENCGAVPESDVCDIGGSAKTEERKDNKEVIKTFNRRIEHQRFKNLWFKASSPQQPSPNPGF